ncbi:MAG: hypothetical protein ACT4P2_07745 [Pseudomonadota bacterium]
MSVHAWLPGLADLLGLASVLLVAVAFVGLGSLVGRAEPFELRLLAGWGLACLALAAFGLVALTFAYLPAAALAGGAVGALWAFRRRDLDPAAGRMLVLGLPVLFVAAAMSASQWDEFAHWLINQRYLFDHDSVPRLGLPSSPTDFAAYPYGLPMVGYFASRIAGAFVENAVILWNTLLVLALALMVARQLRLGAGRDGAPSWGLLAIGFLGATLLNPAFVPKLAFTAYADWTTAVVLAIAAVALWRMLEGLAAVEREQGHALAAGLALAVLVNLKQTNVVLAVLLLAGLFAAAWTAPSRPLGALFRLSPGLLVPGLAVYVLWRLHVHAHLAGAEFAFRPLSQWYWDDAGAILARMAGVAARKGGYFALMLVAVGFAVRALANAERSPLDRLAILVATLFVGFNAFLFATYLGAFDRGEALRVASYWRYNTQLGGVALAFAALGAGALCRRVRAPRLAGALAVALALALPVALAHKIRFDLNPVTRYVRTVGGELAGRLEPGARLAVVDTADNGKSAIVMRYEVGRTAGVRRIAGIDFGDPAAIRAAVGGSPTHVWVHVPAPPIERAFGVAMAPGASYLLARAGPAWRRVGSWPYPGYADPRAVGD